MDKTQIQVSTEVREALKGSKIFDKESYDEVIRRLIAELNKNQETQ